MKTVAAFHILLFTLFSLSGCRGAAGGDEGAIGSVTRIVDLVEQAVSGGELQAVAESNPLHAGDALRVTEGGEGLLDFGDQLRLRLFNDSILGVTAASEPGAPLDVRLFLEAGGFTGELAQSGGQAVFETPGGAQVLVQGTEFMLAYDPQNGVSTAGNFAGTVWVQSGGALLQLPAGWWVDVSVGDQPATPRQLPFDRATYEALARQLGSPLLPLR
ncbi:MAG TPA: hypothetical protein VI776_16775 [Anaerolineales bacterium]|nr:hypothetical protein [Anaerolineales bacterium]